MPTAFSAPSPEQWMKYEHSPKAEQRKFIEGYKDEFIKVPIDGPGSIRAGDHLVREMKEGTGLLNGFHHHMLCTESEGRPDRSCDQRKVKIIEYTVPDRIKASSKFATFKGITRKGKILERDCLVEELVKSKVEKIIWPVKLKRFSVEEVISRARKRLNENCYDALKNNCEHFVTWSMCGLKVSLQITSLFIWLREVVYSTVAGTYNYIGKKVHEKVTFPLLIKLAANASDEVAGFICENAQYIGFGLAISIEAGLATYEIWKAFNDPIQTREEFKTKFVEVVAKAVCRLSFGMIGSLVGSVAGGPLVSLMGGACGAGLGHMIAAMITWWYENYFYVEG